MQNICFLIKEINEHKLFNYLILSNAFLKKGKAISICFIDSLSIRNGRIYGKTQQIDHPLQVGSSIYEADFSETDLSRFDLVWILNFGTRNSFLDKIQILWCLNQETLIINSIDALLFVHSKHFLSLCGDLFQHPETYASNDFDFLWQIYHKSRSQWIVKPAAESMGKDVFMLNPGDTNARAILQNMTGYELKQFCILQRYIPEIRQGEKRILLANGTIIGNYQRTQQEDDHRTNIHQGAKESVCDLSTNERELCLKVGDYFLKMGAYFIGIDLVYPYIVEINVLSPGGLSTIKQLTGKDLSQDVVEQIMKIAP